LLLSEDDLSLHILKLEISCILELATFFLKLLLAVLDKLFLCSFSYKFALEHRILVVLNEVELIGMKLIFDVFLILHFAVELIAKLLFDLFIVGLNFGLLEFLPLTLNLMLLELLLLFQALLGFSFVKNI
jgi:hypothetical protein